MPEDGYHFSKDIADKALQYIRDGRASDPDKPWLLYFAPGAGHAPHHVPKEWADKYKGKFDMGYEKYREQTFARQLEMGLLPKGTKLTPMNPYGDAKGPKGQPWPEQDMVRPWDSLNDDEKRVFCRMAEVFAGFIRIAITTSVGCSTTSKRPASFDNVIVVVVSDNGASGEGGLQRDRQRDEVLQWPGRRGGAEPLKAPRRAGARPRRTTTTAPDGWRRSARRSRCSSATRTTRAGRARRSSSRGPRYIKAADEVRDQYCSRDRHRARCSTSASASNRPTRCNGYTQSGDRGRERPRPHLLADASVPTKKVAQPLQGMLGTRGVWHEGGKRRRFTRRTEAGANSRRDRWELLRHGP